MFPLKPSTETGKAQPNERPSSNPRDFVSFSPPTRRRTLRMLNIFKIHRFEVTWLGLHAFREVFSAFSKKDGGFTRCKLDMEKALAETPGPLCPPPPPQRGGERGAGGGRSIGDNNDDSLRGRSAQHPQKGKDSSCASGSGSGSGSAPSATTGRRAGGGGEEAEAGVQDVRRHGQAHGRLWHVVRSPDALSLLRTLTT